MIRCARPTLRRRHIMMISIGGTIGMGLLLSSSKALRLGGSTGLIVSYAMMGLVVAAVMSCISEMVKTLARRTEGSRKTLTITGLPNT